MFEHLVSTLPPDAVKIVLVLFLTFLLGLEREEHRQEGRFNFGGVRTFPLLGLFAYGLAAYGGEIAVAAGVLSVTAIVVVSYLHKLKVNANAGVTSEVCVFVAFVIGALVCKERYWLAASMTVAALLLLELKVFLEKLASRVAPEEVIAFTKFLLLAAVILPIVPNEAFTEFQINPFKTWLVVVAVSGVSYASYALQKWLGESGGILVVALLGGAYSSTVTTIALARQSQQGAHAPRLFAGGMLVSSGVTYARILLLVWLFNHALGTVLAPWFLGLTVIACLVGAILARTQKAVAADATEAQAKKNPLELRSAFMFAAIFVVMMVVTNAAVGAVGSGALYGLASLMGLSDVAPFVMSIAQSDATKLAAPIAASSIAIAVASNNLVKGGYAIAFGEKSTGRLGLALHAGLAVAGLLPLIWLLAN